MLAFDLVSRYAGLMAQHSATSQLAGNISQDRCVVNVHARDFRYCHLYPGISLYPMILDAHFYTPVHREIALMSGFRSNKKEAMVKLLSG
jgi:hypothetical protein